MDEETKRLIAYAYLLSGTFISLAVGGFTSWQYGFLTAGLWCLILIVGAVRQAKEESKK